MLRRSFKVRLKVAGLGATGTTIRRNRNLIVALLFLTAFFVSKGNNKIERHLREKTNVLKFDQDHVRRNRKAIVEENSRSNGPKSCLSKWALQTEGYLMPIHPSPTYEKKILDYSNHHGSCMAAAGNFSQALSGNELVYYEAKNGRRVHCQFIFLHADSLGLGNRLLATISAFGYALVTNRVLVIMDSVVLDTVCNPFSSHGWYVEWPVVQKFKSESKIHPKDFSLDQKLWEDKVAASETNGRISSGFVEVHYLNSVEDQNFFCDFEQQRIKLIDNFFISSDQYFLPALFLVPSFRSKFEKLFPDLLPFPHLSRFLLSPNNEVWERITKIYTSHFAPFTRKVGVQVRTFVEEDHFAHSKILDCLVNVSQELPPPTTLHASTATKQAQEKTREDTAAAKQEKTLIYVASLHHHHALFLRSQYNSFAAFSVYYYTSEGEEKHGFELDSLAFTEMWLLAMCDLSFTTYFSTFGYIASGLSGSKPYLLNIIPKEAKVWGPSYEYNKRPVCELCASAEPCFHSAPNNRACAAARKSRSDDRAARVPSYLQPCQDAWSGYRIVPTMQTKATIV